MGDGAGGGREKKGPICVDGREVDNGSQVTLDGAPSHGLHRGRYA